MPMSIPVIRDERLIGIDVIADLHCLAHIAGGDDLFFFDRTYPE